MANSQNGWPASRDREAIGVRPFAVHGVAFPGGVKSGDVATVLAYVADQFHRRVEPLVSGWCWGHAYRDVTAGSSLSNHASGTAMDINAPRHPYDVRGTFSGVQRATIRAILDEVSNTVRWGGDYRGTPDEMHFEINAGATAVAAVARRLRQAAPPLPQPQEEPGMGHTFYVRGNTKTDVYCVTTTGEEITSRHVTAAEWTVAQAAGLELVWVEQPQMDAFLAEVGP